MLSGSGQSHVGTSSLLTGTNNGQSTLASCVLYQVQHGCYSVIWHHTSVAF